MQVSRLIKKIATALIPALLLFGTTAFAQATPALTVDCSRGQSLQSALRFASPGSTIIVKGTCDGAFTITTDGLRLDGRATAILNGGGKDVITINGAHQVVLTGLTITGGGNGVVENAAQATLLNDVVKQNAVTGIVAQSSSSVTVSGGSTSQNGLHGIDVEASSSLNVTGAYSSTGNAVLGIFVNNGSSITLTAATLTVNSNALGVQVGTNASGFLDGLSTLNSSNNVTVGLTMVSGAHMADFGGTIIANGNGINGISLNSKAGLDLDAASQVQASNNSTDGVHLEQLSVMTVFNTPQFSDTNGTTTLTAQGNQGDGINELTNSEMLVDNFAALQVTGNTHAGLSLDDGSSLTFGQSFPPVPSDVQSKVTGNHPDLSLTFGSRITTFANDTIGTFTCDGTALVRGPVSITCPH
jgi:Periplasmic copper-binding protein (NosD)